MKLYRLYYGEDIRQGIFQGSTGTRYFPSEILSYMNFYDEFTSFCRFELHKPRHCEFEIEPNENALFYFKSEAFHRIKYMLDDLIEISRDLNVIINIKEVDLSEIQSYKCYYQDENQMCLEY